MVKMNWRFAFGVFLFFLFWSCDSVSDLLNLDKTPVLDEQGIVVSADRVNPGDTVRASISATNPVDGPLYYQWTATGGDFMPPADKDTVYWIAPVKGGTYTIYVKVSNTEKSITTHKEIAVISSSKPLVRILKPEEGARFVLTESVPVEASATHENGIARVRLFAGDSLISETGGKSSGNYQFTFLPVPSMVGTLTLIVEAEAANQFAAIGRDSVNVVIKGMVVGKK
ncbi:MAG TPA: hypothetical protein ENJ89_08560 [Caldithrix abyssi]|uniref:PKD domain-containing protein n=1 Tax=Caldithrix abyssi TaxID=187145 RepID=A0A7V5UFF5_CALAY|nr:hypothetical protein [Caldithrix abyssi]